MAWGNINYNIERGTILALLLKLFRWWRDLPDGNEHILSVWDTNIAEITE
jgi:hypothetical protein